MMNIVIFGASGKTGKELVKQALEEGHQVTAFVRNPERLDIVNDKLKLIQGDVYNTEEIHKAVINQDVVVCALGAGNSLKKTTIRATGTSNIIESMKKHHVKRLIIVSAMGIGDSWKTLSAFNKFFFATVLKNSRNDHESQEKEVRESKLDWTIIRPSGLTDTAKSNEYVTGERLRAKIAKIARADVAGFILKTIDDDSFVRKAVTITKA